ncbi:MAG TPA: glycoside hydrolase family 2 TIM barrel-domain containing protein, partial [Chitinophagaceae bacterium]|nr:glycoside hydrolase family 2 TIM barrel-domain containing protein [Chitinophagaceae bacterium]
QGAFYAFKYDITKILKYGEKNLLEVTVAKHSANESVNNAERRADFWIFGGIFRPVWLEVLPSMHIANVLIDAKADGSFSADVLADGFPQSISMQLYTSSNVKFGKQIDVKFGESPNTIIIKSKFISPNLWTSETPYLYKAVFSVYRNGKLFHVFEKKFGFRTIEVKQRDGIYINGVKVKFKGVNRHSFRPEAGRTMSRQNSIEDVLLMKDMNMNAVRMSHYPPDDHFLDVCDSLGLFVMDELAGWHGHYDTPTGTKLLKEMIEHDANHPSIVIWSNGNEGGHNFELDSLFTQYDIQKRPVIHPWQLFNGIETQHYREYNYGIGNYEYGREIVMPTEFLHGQFDGGHGAGLEDYWEKMWHDPLSAGGFLWDFADNAVVRKDMNDSLDTDKHRAADGILGPHHEKEGSYYAIKEIWSPVYFERKEITKLFDGKLNVENRFHFTNLKQCSFEYELYSFGSSYFPFGGKINSPNARPGDKAVIQLQLPKNWAVYDALYITVRGIDGKEIFTWSFPIVKPYELAGKKLSGLKTGSKVRLNETDSVFSISANGITVDINKNSGVLRKVQNEKGIIPFGNGPVIQEGVSNFHSFTHRFENDNLIIESGYEKKNSFNTLRWTVYPTGVIKMQVNYFPDAYFTNFVGVNFSLPEKEIRAVDYMGNGPYRVWKNRMKGNKFGVWHKEYNNSETGESPWIYPEFKGYQSNMYWCKFIMSTQSFEVYTENEDLFLRLFTPSWKTDQWHNYEPIFPSGDISFMNGISSIGTKTQRNETTGPMGSKNIFYDYEKDPSRALKLVLYFDFSVNK